MQTYRSNPPSRLMRPSAPVPSRDTDAPSPIVNDVPSTIQLLREIREHMANTGLTASKFGTLALSDPSFVHRVIGGAVLREETIRRARKFMRENVHA